MGDNDGEIIEESSAADNKNGASLLNVSSIEGSGCIVLKGDGAALPTEYAEFCPLMPVVKNWFVNQGNSKITDGYNTEGELLYIPKDLCKDENEGLFNKRTIFGPTTNPPTQFPSSSTCAITIDDIKK